MNADLALAPFRALMGNVKMHFIGDNVPLHKVPCVVCALVRNGYAVHYLPVSMTDLLLQPVE